jgi:hypothetical protein
MNGNDILMREKEERVERRGRKGERKQRERKREREERMNITECLNVSILQCIQKEEQSL